MIFSLIAIIFSIGAICFATYIYLDINKQKKADKEVENIGKIIRDGAMSFLKEEYKQIAIFSVIVFLIILFVPYLSYKLAIAFLVGAIFSAVSGYGAMIIATMANVKTAIKCQEFLRRGFRVSYSAGLAIGLTVSGFGLFGIGLVYLIFPQIDVLFGFAFGASLVALFARLGGGIYTKAADIGADMVSKTELEIPEDDIRNPAVIADNVGDNVGDVAGMSADLFESYVDVLIVAMAFGLIMLPTLGVFALYLPLIVYIVGMAGSAAGYFLIKYLRHGSVRSMIAKVSALSSFIILAGSFFFINQYMDDINIFWSLLIGLIVGMAITLATNYYTSEKFKPTINLSKMSLSGDAQNIISGMSLGFMSAAVSMFLISVSLFIAYSLAGLFGVAVAAIGMLSGLGTTLAIDTFGAMADNAAGIARLSFMKEEVRIRAEKLDSVGNSMAAVGKGFAVSSAALTAIILLAIFAKFAGLAIVDILQMKALVGLFIGGLMPFVFSSMALGAVSETADKMIKEVRRQIKKIANTENSKPDYNKCIKISTVGSLKKIFMPAFLALTVPVLVGVYLGAASLATFLAGSITVGLLLAFFMANAGGAWDNAKKIIETNGISFNEKIAHKASVTGDMVGDPFKDTAGPSLNILIKLMAIVALLIVPLL